MTSHRDTLHLPDPDSYSYAGDDLRDKTLVTVIAPTAVGKSALIADIVSCAQAQGIDGIAEVGTRTTRPARAGDPVNYVTGLSHQAVGSAIAAGQLVNWAPHPSGHIYGTDVASYPGDINLLPTLPAAVPMLARAGFGRMVQIYLTTDPETWSARLRERVGEQLDARLQEAEDSLDWALSRRETLTLLDNSDGADNLRKLSQKVLDIVVHNAPAPSDEVAVQHAQGMLEYIRQQR